ncbi:MAG TPA: acyl transferase [Bacteroidia bacterium]|jgi:phenylacetate-coenzyme A ligase PaaK-like adenylate-forming protein|nr:acyl transferase [Bacteroidia bacterium]
MHLSKIESVLNQLNEIEFNNLTLSIFQSQYQNNLVYRTFSQSLKTKPETIDHYSKIPFLPIEFFKSQDVICNAKKDDFIVFTSSSTSGQTPSRHIVSDITVYEKSFIKGFELFYGKPSDYAIAALLPNYLERKDSSLVYMFERLIKESAHPLSGFFMDDHDKLIDVLKTLKQQNKKTLLIGVTYALLDLADKNIKLTDNFIVMETGGMKGKREELLKEEVHQILKQKFGVSTIHSEYGMTELLSQAYSKGDGLFDCPPWMKVLVRDTEDPLNYVKENKTGGLNIIDLANVNSCSFIATQDLGRSKGNGQFELLGRFDNSDIRGCNLMVS